MAANTNIAEIFWKQVESRKDAPFLSFRSSNLPEYKSISWQEAGSKVAQLIKYLTNLGVKPGTKIAIFSSNTFKWIIIDVAILSTKAISIPIYQSSRSQDLINYFNICEIEIIFVEDAKKLEELRSISSPHLKHVIILDENFTQTSPNLPYQIHNWKDIFKLNISEDYSEIKNQTKLISGTDIASIIFTSGTSGLPKAVQLNHSNLVSAIEAFQERIKLDHNDQFLSILPLAHIFERTACEFYAIAIGANIFFCNKPDYYTEDLKHAHITYSMVVPRLLEKIYLGILKKLGYKSILLNIPGIKNLLAKKIKSELAPHITAFVSGGAPLNPRIAKFFQKLNIPVLEGYGLTETTGGITVNPPQANKPGTVGPALMGAEIKIAEDNEILCRGTSVFQGYYKNNLVNIEAFYDPNFQEYTQWNPEIESNTKKWFRTGDLGAIANDGYLKITGRKKELIVTSYGKKVALNKIEQMFQTSLVINQIVVCGDNRKYLAALISIHPEHVTPDKQEAIVQAEIDSANKQLANFEQIKCFRILEQPLSIEAGELTQTLKIKRSVVVQKYKKLIEEMYAE